MLEIAEQAIPIYEDDHVVVLWFAGRSAELLITFGDLITLAEGRRFYAENPVEKLGLNCIGFMGKRPNWYPMTSMLKALVSIEPYLSHFDERITYGGSMGGYAALKYSGMLGASHAIAFCPQWSLDESECDGFYPGWQEWFVPDMCGMGIRASEMSRRAYVFFDPMEWLDSAHARQIGVVNNETRFIWVPFVEHHVTPVMAGTMVLRTLIDSCRLDDVQALRRLSRRQRRKNWFYQQKMAERFIASAPRAALRYVLLQPPGIIGLPPFLFRNMVLLAERLSWMGAKEESLACLKLASNHVQSPIEKAVLAEMETRLSGSQVFILSFNGAILAYDVSTGECCLAAPEGHRIVSGRIPLRLIINCKRANLYVRTGVADIVLGVLPDGGLSADAEAPADFELLSVGCGRFQLRYQEKFVCADPIQGSLVCNRAAASQWETLSFSALGD